MTLNHGPDTDAWRALEGQRGLVEQVRENSSRFAWANAHYTTTGVGQVVEPSVFKFGMAFLDIPYFHKGASFDTEVALEDIADADLPTFDAVVYRWQRTGSGFYIGAWCYFIVNAGASVNPATMQTVFTVSWSGIASKDFISSPSFPVSDLEV